MSGKSAVARVAGKQRTVAEILHVVFPVPAYATGMPEPWNPDTVVDLEIHHVFNQIDPANDLVTRDDRIFDAGKLCIKDVEVPSDRLRIR